MPRKVSLTFDNGPFVGATERLLDIMGKRGIHATFFFVGERLADPANRELARQVQVAGHWIGHHSMRHIIPLGMSEDPDHVEKEIAEADRAVAEFAHPDKFFRPPGKASLGPHLLSQAALDYCMAHRHTIVTWTTIPRDGVDPREAWVERAMGAFHEQEWMVPVLHDHHLGVAMQNFENFVDRVIDEGGVFVQEFPHEVLPLLRGDIRQPAEQFATITARKTA